MSIPAHQQLKRTEGEAIKLQNGYLLLFGWSCVFLAGPGSGK